MRLPLHLDPNDHSQETELRRVEHHTAMTMLAGEGRGGFRQPTGRSRDATRIERIAIGAFGND